MLAIELDMYMYQVLRIDVHVVPTCACMWHGPFVPDAINFTIKYMYMMGGGWSVLWASCKTFG